MVVNIPFLEKIFGSLRSQLLDDPIDRLNYKFAASILLFFAILVSAKQFTGEPIHCWTPAQFTGARDKYAHDYCFIQSTYFVGDGNDHFPNKMHERSEQIVSYYQWVPVILAIQALAFYMPNYIWKTLIGYCGVDLYRNVEMAVKARSVENEVRAKYVDTVAGTLSDALGIRGGQDKYRRRDRFHKFGADYLSNAVTTAYVVIKMIYIANIFIQLCVSSAFLRSNGVFWGMKSLYDIITGHEWSTTGAFPRVSFCDFSVWTTSDLKEDYTLQCVLLINMFNEKIFIFLWFLYAALLCVTVANAFVTLSNFLLSGKREKSVYRWLKHAPDFDPGHVRRFTSDVLRSDGLLVLRFIENHAGLSIAREIATKLWIDYASENEGTILSMNPKCSGEFPLLASCNGSVRKNSTSLGRSDNGIYSNYKPFSDSAYASTRC